MNWATLAESCPLIFESIVRHATAKNDFPRNKRMMRIRELGQVCSQWKGAISASRNLFKSVDECTIWWCSSRNDGEDKEAKLLVNDGFMRVTKKLVIKEISLEDAGFLCNAGDNQVKEFSFKLRDSQITDPSQWLKKMIDLFGMSKKAHVFKFDLAIYNEQLAEKLRKLLTLYDNDSTILFLKQGFIWKKNRVFRRFEFTASFECDESLQVRVREWLTDVKTQYGQLPGDEPNYVYGGIGHIFNTNGRILQA